MQLNPDTSWDIMMLSIAGDVKSGWKFGKPTPFLSGSFTNRMLLSHPMADGSPMSAMIPAAWRFMSSPFLVQAERWQISVGGEAPRDGLIAATN